MVLVIEFYDSATDLVHVYKDEGSRVQLKILIFDTPRNVSIWSLIGVDEDIWWYGTPQVLIA